MDKNQILKIYGKDYKAMTIALLQAAGLSAMIDKGMKIGIKPNLVSPTPADFGATTHPEVVEGLIEYLLAAGHTDITIIEGSWVGDRTEEAFEFCGYRALCEKYNIPFYDMQKDTWHPVSCQGMDINICDKVSNIDFLINVPVLKGHGQTRMTCALKNMKGLIPNSEKRLFHKLGLHKPIAHLNIGIHQDFILVDHICGDLTFEDGGNPVETDSLYVSLDPVLTDAYGCALMGIDLSEVPYISMAEELDIGSSKLEGVSLISYSWDHEKNQLVKLSEHAASKEDKYEPFRKSEDKLLDVKFAVEEVESCSACHGALLPALVRIKEQGHLDELMEILGGKISIGQGYKGKAGAFGIGACCTGFDKNVKGCPPESEDIYKALMEIIEQKEYN